MSFKEKVLFFGCIAAGLIALYGWVWNVTKIFYSSEVTGEVILRAVGVVVWPLGAVMGFL